MKIGIIYLFTVKYEFKFEKGIPFLKRIIKL